MLMQLKATLAALADTQINRRLNAMAWYCSGATNNELIENLSKEGLIKNERVKRAMMAVSRDSSTQPPHNHTLHPISATHRISIT
jgi:protein-L-isoaspartate(D-aspartate) O-methyltransferase